MLIEVNPDGSGMWPTDVLDDIARAAEHDGDGSSDESWDKATSWEIFADPTLTEDTPSDRDKRNILAWADLGDPRIIAVCSLWYNPKEKEILEFDIVFNTYFEWGDARDPFTPDVMDLQNIATHELGHGAGLDDLYAVVYSKMTMYGYSDYGETKKRDLAWGDIDGVHELYGE